MASLEGTPGGGGGGGGGDEAPDIISLICARLCGDSQAQESFGMTNASQTLAGTWDENTKNNLFKII